jgi:hypothetical protein
MTAVSGVAILSVSPDLGAKAMGEVTFTDGPPYEFPAVQDAEANAAGSSVELSLFINIPDRPLAAVPVMVALPLDVARKLLGQFQAVVPIAESAAGQQQ